MKTDVVVIGGGIIGCSIAYYAAKKRLRTTLVEKNGIGGGTSSACDGFVYLQTKKPGDQLKLAMLSADMYQGLSKELAYEVHYKRPGGLILIETPELLKVMERVVAKQREQGMEVEIVDGDYARKLEPCLSSHVIAAGYSTWDGHVNPIDVTLAYAKAAAALGAQILTHTPVTDIKLKSGAVCAVVTPNGLIETETAIIAGGVWSPEIGNMLGLNIPIRPRRGQMLVSEPLAPMFNTVMLDSRYIALKHNPELAKNTDDEFMKLGIGLGLEQTQHGNILIGNSRDFAGFDFNTTYEVTRGIARYVSRFIPFLNRVNIIRTFAGLRPYCEDGSPILGPVKAVPGLIMATGHEGDGVALAPITGELISDLIKHGKTSFDLTPFSFDRFAAKQGGYQ